jgi:hypothetical protein
MNKHNTLPNLMQKIVSDAEIQTIAKAGGYCDPSRTFTLRTLTNFFLLAAVHQWKSFRHGADVSHMHGLPKFHYFFRSPLFIRAVFSRMEIRDGRCLV